MHRQASSVGHGAQLLAVLDDGIRPRTARRSARRWAFSTARSWQVDTAWADGATGRPAASVRQRAAGTFSNSVVTAAASWSKWLGQRVLSR